MLTAGIIVMAASVVVGVLTLTSVALSSGARSAARRARTAKVAFSERKKDALYFELFGPAEPGVGYHSAGQRLSPSHAKADHPAPRLVVALATLSAAGLVLGLLMVMIPSIP